MKSCRQQAAHLQLLSKVTKFTLLDVLWETTRSVSSMKSDRIAVVIIDQISQDWKIKDYNFKFSN